MRRSAAPLAAIVLAVAAAAPAHAASTMFKCVENGRTIYQQQACAVTRQPEPAASVPAAASAASAAASAASAAAAKLRRPSPAASSARATHR